jgi:hypothetical protein
MQRIEHGYAVGASDHRLAVQRERLRAQLVRDRSDAGIAVGPVIPRRVNSRTAVPSRRTISR